MNGIFRRFTGLQEKHTWIGIAALYLAGAFLLLAAGSVFASKSAWLLCLDIVVATGVVWLSKRFFGLGFVRALWHAGIAYLGLGVLYALLVSANGLSQTCLALAIACLSGAVVGSSIRLQPMRARVADLTSTLSRRYVTIRNAAVALTLLFALRLILVPLSHNTVWGLAVGSGAQTLVIADAVVGAAFIYWFLGTFTPDWFPRLIGSLGWIAAGARMDPQLAHFMPTFLAPLFASLFLSDRSSSSKAQRSFFSTGVLLGPLVLALISPALLLTWAIIFVAATAIRPRTVEVRGDILLSVIGLTMGTLVACFIHPVIPVGDVLVSRHLDGNLRDASADGAWPWELLVPSIAGGIGGIATAFYHSVGRVGNFLMISSGVGSACVVAAAWAILVSRRLVYLFPPFALSLLVVALVAALPSHIFSIPLPTAAEAISLLDGKAFLVPAAGIAIALAGSCFLALSVQALDERRRLLAILVVLVVLVAELSPNRNLLVDVTSLSLAQGIGKVKSQRTTIFASLYGDDPWATYAHAITRALPAHNLKFRLLPTKGLTAAQAKHECYAVVNFGAYHGYGAPGMQQFISVPASLQWSQETMPRFAQAAPGLNVYRVYGDVAVYHMQRRSATCK